MVKIFIGARSVGSRFKVPEKARIIFLIVLSIPYFAGGVEFYVSSPETRHN